MAGVRVFGGEGTSDERGLRAFELVYARVGADSAGVGGGGKGDIMSKTRKEDSTLP